MRKNQKGKIWVGSVVLDFPNFPDALRNAQRRPLHKSLLCAFRVGCGLKENLIFSVSRGKVSGVEWWVSFKKGDLWCRFFSCSANSLGGLSKTDKAKPKKNFTAEKVEAVRPGLALPLFLGKIDGGGGWAPKGNLPARAARESFLPSNNM